MQDLDRWVMQMSFSAVRITLTKIMPEVVTTGADRGTVTTIALSQYWEHGGCQRQLKKILVDHIIKEKHRFIAVVDRTGKVASEIFARHLQEVLNMLTDEFGDLSCAHKDT